jgi:hypothetical protein
MCPPQKLEMATFAEVLRAVAVLSSLIGDR